MDFYKIKARETKHDSNEVLEVYPDFSVAQSRDLMIRGGAPYAIWDDEQGLWSQDPYEIIRMVDDDLYKEAERLKSTATKPVVVKVLRYDSTRSWKKFLEFAKTSPDNYHPLNNKVVFENSEVKKTDYSSRRLPYALAEGDISAYDELVGQLYAPEERAKIEWAIGSIVAGDSKKIQKFVVFYGSAGTGKSTMINIIDKLFSGYTTPFEGKLLGSANGAFATEPFKDNPLVAFEHDSDLSKLEDNTRFNSIIAHEEMTMNEKYKPKYKAQLNAMLILGSNQPVKISDAKSGMLRRLIDVHPTGVRFPEDHYDALMARIEFELGAIAHHCLQTYLSMGKNYYNTYRPQEMQLQTDAFYNFIEDHFDVFKEQDYTTLNQAYKMYTTWCEESGIGEKFRLSKHKMRDELRNYFFDFTLKKYIDGNQARSVYSDFIADRFRAPKTTNGTTFSLVLDETESLFDSEMANQPAQLASTSGTMYKKWDKVTTRLKDINTIELHWVRVPEDHIFIDFDLKDSKEGTALERNLAAASEWPPTYAEISKSGHGIHLHYRYTGDVGDLASSYSEDVEVKTLNGDASLRRRLSRCNAVPIATISTGLPLKGKKEKMLQTKTITTERGLRELIGRNLRKEIHPGTKPSVDFIKKILDDAQESGMKYDVTDLRTKILAFANNSTNQAGNSLKVVKEMKWASEIPGEEIPADKDVKVADERIVFFDVEVYKNLFVICWKYQGEDEVVRMVNPAPQDVEMLFELKLVGFYNRRFDNHILYAASMGAKPEELFKISQKIVEGNRSVTFGAAYNLSYADVWDFSSEKMSLKKFEIKLGILHMELDLPWDEPVDEKDWDQVVEYCANDVRATEAVFEDRKGDFVARQILAELSGLTVNDTTQTHTAKIILGSDKHPQKKFVYTDLSKEFPGYKFELGKSLYKGIDPGEGGYVYAEPGIYENVAVLDIVSMHPASMERMNMFGPYTKNFSDLRKARVAIKHKDWELARDMMDGRLAPYLQDESTAEQLAYALKIVINTVYGLTSAKFENPFRDMHNIDNIAAKRGALFMIDLREELEKSGIRVIHIKTDSVKIPDATPEAIAAVKTLGSLYGYEFEHEGTYDKFVLVNDAVFVGGKATVPWDDMTRPFPGYEWNAVGAQYAHPYVFKMLFTGEDIGFDDFCEARSVMKGTMYLCDPDSEEVKEVRHVGRTGLFVPVLKHGYLLYRKNEDKYYSVSGTKGHLWMEAQIAQDMGDELEIDMTYFDKLKDDAIKTIEKFGSFEEFIGR